MPCGRYHGRRREGQCAGYREVEGVDTDSTTETYVAARAMLD